MIADAIGIIKSKLGVARSTSSPGQKEYSRPACTSPVSSPPGVAPTRVTFAKLVLLGGPNKGLDTPFRHGIQNAGLVWPECGGTLNFPAAMQSLFCFGAYYSHPEYSYAGTGTNDVFPGARQALYRWDAVYRSIRPSGTGTRSTTGAGVGIRTPSGSRPRSTRLGHRPLRAAPSPASVSTYLLCGGSRRCPISSEYTGPSDGVVFVASCTDTGGLTTVSGNATFWADNHLMLGWEHYAALQIGPWLGYNHPALRHRWRKRRRKTMNAAHSGVEALSSSPSLSVGVATMFAGSGSRGAQTISSFNYGLPVAIGSLDLTRNMNGWTSAVAVMVTQPLERFDKSGKSTLVLARSISEPNRTTVVYRLRPGLKFSSGKNLTRAGRQVGVRSRDCCRGRRPDGIDPDEHRRSSRDRAARGHGDPQATRSGDSRFGRVRASSFRTARARSRPGRISEPRPRCRSEPVRTGISRTRRVR